METIQGGKLLDALAKLFFSGIDKIFDEAAEYEEEMGVLKQKTVIPIKDDDPNSDREYTVTVWLSPVKDKDGYYYVEAKSSAKDVDLSEINEKVMKLDKTNVNSLKEKIYDICQKKGYTHVEKEDKEESEDSEEKTAKSENAKIVKQLINDAKEQGFPIVSTESDDGTKLQVSAEASVSEKDDRNCELELRVVDSNGNEVEDFDPETYTITVISRSGKALDLDHFLRYIKDNMDRYLKEAVPVTSSVDVKLLKSSKDGEISFTAINASCDIHAAMDMIETVADDTEFVDSLAADVEQSYRITDDGEEYNVANIEDVDVSGTYAVLFEDANNVLNRMRAYKWALGGTSWDCDSTCCTAMWNYADWVDTCAEWIIRNTGSYPETSAAPVEWDALVGEDGKVSLEFVKERVAADMQATVELIDTYYCNLNPEELTRANGMIDSLKHLLTFA